MRVLLIGTGAIGRYVQRHLPADTGARIEWILARPGGEDRAREFSGPGMSVITAPEEAEGASLALECAGHGALAQHGPPLLEKGVDVVTVSAGALAELPLAEALELAARRGGSALEIATGAIGAVDALAAARCGGLSRVTHTARKPPQGWRGTPAERALNLDRITEATEFFRGTAREAASTYPKNANVAATIALAGLGLDATTSRLIADPTTAGNLHEIEAEGAFGRFRFQIEGTQLAENPKSSSLAAMSVTRAVIRRAARIKL